MTFTTPKIGKQLYGVTRRQTTLTSGQTGWGWNPPADVLTSHTPTIIWSHPQGQSTAPGASYFMYPLIHAAIQRGWRFASGSQHGDNSCGNASTLTDLADLRAWQDSISPVGPVILAGGSMGGLATANAVAHASVSGVIGAFVIDGVFDLHAFELDATYNATVVSGYGLTEATLTGSGTLATGATSLPTTASYPTIGTQLLVGVGTANEETVTTTAASTGTAVAVTATTKSHTQGSDKISDYPTKTAGYNPMIATASLFTGIPWRFYAGSADTTVPEATHTTPFAARIAAAPEAAIVQHANGHLANNGIRPYDVEQFIDRCLVRAGLE